jgi:hypothetical protein
MQREVSRDADIVVAAMISIVGSTLIFQGWRLDPLLLLCQVRLLLLLLLRCCERHSLCRHTAVADADTRMSPLLLCQRCPHRRR